MVLGNAGMGGVVPELLLWKVSGCLLGGGYDAGGIDEVGGIVRAAVAVVA